MSAATIVFMDTVGFSRKSTAEQKRLVEALTDEVTHYLRTLLNPPFQGRSGFSPTLLLMQHTPDALRPAAASTD